jgi:hypothetical protein
MKSISMTETGNFPVSFKIMNFETQHPNFSYNYVTKNALFFKICGIMEKISTFLPDSGVL